MDIEKILNNVCQKELRRNQYSYSESACWYGEMIRNYAFDPDKYGNSTGCYSTFEVNPAFKPVEKNTELYRKLKAEVFLDMPEDVTLSLYFDMSNHIFVGWWWDGDGDLTVGEIKQTENGITVLRAANNNDCKKDYVWLWLI